MYQFNIDHQNSQELTLQEISLYVKGYSSLKYLKSRQLLPPLPSIICITRINKSHPGQDWGLSVKESNSKSAAQNLYSQKKGFFSKSLIQVTSQEALFETPATTLWSAGRLIIFSLSQQSVYIAMSFPKEMLIVCYMYTVTSLLHASTIYRGGLEVHKTCSCGRNGEETFAWWTPSG